MNLKDVTRKLGRGIAAAQIAGNLVSVPITKDGTPDLNRQYAKYAKHVKLEDIRRQISRDTTKTFNPTAVLDKRTAKNLRKK